MIVNERARACVNPVWQKVVWRGKAVMSKPEALTYVSCMVVLCAKAVQQGATDTATECSSFEMMPNLRRDYNLGKAEA